MSSSMSGRVPVRPTRRTPAIEPYICTACTILLYTSAMQVSVTDLRANLRDWLKKAAAGDEILVTDRGIPIARIVGASAKTTLERLTAEGVIGLPESPHRPVAAKAPRVKSRGPISDMVSELRD